VGTEGGDKSRIDMRKRFRTPCIYKRGHWWCFKITNSFGKRIEVKSVSERDAKMKRSETSHQVMSDLNSSLSYRVTIDQGIEY